MLSASKENFSELKPLFLSKQTVLCFGTKLAKRKMLLSSEKAIKPK